MKKTVQSVLILFVVAFLTPADTAAQRSWSWLNPLPQGNDLRAVCSPAAGALVAVGDNGVIIQSSDGGNNWILLESGTRANLKAVSFSDASAGFVVGELGTILRTTDGGATWVQRHADSSMTLNGVSCINPTTATAVGFPGITLRTTNGGATWASQLTGPEISLNAVSFVNANTGFSVGWGANSGGYVYRTTNGGSSWSRRVLPTSVEFREYLGVWFTDANTATAVGSSGTIIRTTDGGSTWSVQTSGTIYPLQSVHFIDANNGAVVGEVAILRTTNGGATWVSQSTGAVETVFGVWLADANTTFLAGYGGLLLRSTNSGSSWNVLTGGSRLPVYSGSLINGSTSTLVGYGGTIARSEDGKTFVQQTSGVTQHLQGVSFSSGQVGVAVGDHGTIVHTTDAGATWMDRSIPEKPNYNLWFSDISLLPNGLGLIAGSEVFVFPPAKPITYSRIFRSTDSGASWSEVPITGKQRLTALSVIDPLTVVVVGDSGSVLRSTDGGGIWVDLEENPPQKNLSAVVFSGTLGYAVGEAGTIFRSTDGGASWSVEPTYTSLALHGLAFLSPTYWTAVGDSGTVLWSTDNGQTWSKVFSGTNKHLYTVSMSASNRAVVAGDAGVVLEVALDGSPITSAGEPIQTVIPLRFYLAQNYPNPFNPTTTIHYQLSSASRVTLRVYNVLGQEIATLVDGEKLAGVHRGTFDARGLNSGVYFYRLSANEGVVVRKMLLLK